MEPNDQDVDLNNEIDLELEADEEVVVEVPKDKPVETPEAKYSRLERQKEQLLKKHPELGKTESKERATPSSDLGEKAFLIANGYKEADEIALAKKLTKETGKDLESLLGTTYFQTELNKLREDRAEQNATPKGSKRSNNSSVDSVEYWIAKGELPPASEVQLRRDVVNARMKKEESKGVFYNS